MLTHRRALLTAVNINNARRWRKTEEMIYTRTTVMHYHTTNYIHKPLRVKGIGMVFALSQVCL